MSPAPDAAPGSLKAAWLVAGKDPSLVADALAGLLPELLGKADRSLVLEDFSGDELDLASVVDACRTPPFLADRRVILVRVVAKDGHFDQDQLMVLASYLDEPLETTKLVVTASGDKLPVKFVNAFKKSPVATVLDSDIDSKAVHGWVVEHLAHAPVKLLPAAAALVESHLGEDFNRLGALLATLETAYGPGARIGPEEVAPYLGQAGSVPPGI